MPKAGTKMAVIMRLVGAVLTNKQIAEQMECGEPYVRACKVRARNKKKFGLVSSPRIVETAKARVLERKLGLAPAKCRRAAWMMRYRNDPSDGKKYDAYVRDRKLALRAEQGA